MQLGIDRSLARRHFLCGCCAGSVIGFTPAIAQAADEVVPVSLEPRHRERFKNGYVRVMEVIIDPGDTTLFHKHELDLAFAVIRGAEVKNEVPNNPEAAISRLDTKAVRFSEYQGKPYIHRVTNRGAEPYWLIAFEIVWPEPGKFSLGNRSEAPAYVSELENNRLHIWRLKLDPGQIAPPIVNSGPGLRVLLSGDQITETMGDAQARDVSVRQGGFEWQPAGARQAIKNTGQSPVELVEFELR
jgi:hypothetical protein